MPYRFELLLHHSPIVRYSADRGSGCQKIYGTHSTAERWLLRIVSSTEALLRGNQGTTEARVKTEKMAAQSTREARLQHYGPSLPLEKLP